MCGNEWDIYGPRGLRESLHEALAGQMQYIYFPVSLDQCGANIRYHDLVEGILQSAISESLRDIRIIPSLRLVIACRSMGQHWCMPVTRLGTQVNGLIGVILC